MSEVIKSGMKRILAALLLLTLAAPAWAGWDEGVAAYKRGDYATALREFRPLAEQGNAGAQSNLALMYRHGQGVPQDYAQAARWYRKAAEQGHASAQTNLGNLYSIGQGVPQDYAEMMRWYRKAAEQGDASALSNLGWKFGFSIMFGNGQGAPPQDHIQAHMWFNLAAARAEIGLFRDEQAKNRDMVAKQMTPAQISEAQRLASEWMAAFEKRKKE